MQPFIPFNKPFLVGPELDYIREAVAAGNLSGDGEFSLRASRLLREMTAAAHVLLTPSCTAALELAATVLEWGQGDEVILPSFTFVSTASAVVRAGARPVFVEVDPETLQIDPQAVRAAITPRTKGIIPVHYAGACAPMEEIEQIASEADVTLVEDAAHALGSTYRGRSLGSFGKLATISFHETKNIQCGQGGALFIQDPTFRERAEILRDKGTNRAALLRGQVDRYTWVDVGSAYQMSELSAAYLTAQLERTDFITARRRALQTRYTQLLTRLAERGDLRLPTVIEGCVTNGHIAYVLLENEATRRDLLQHLNDQGIWAVFHYVPLHTSPMGERLGYRPGDLPITESVAGRLLRLPLFHELTEQEQDRVVASIEEFFTKRVSKSRPETVTSEKGSISS